MSAAVAARPARGRSAALLSVRDGVAALTLPRARVDLATAQGLCQAAERIAHDESIRVVLVQGPPGLFCLGSEGETAAWPDWVGALAGLAAPVIAVVGGAAVADGAELALAADIRICAARAWLAFPQVSEGVLPRHGATQRLPRIIGRARAMDLLLSGRRVGAREAHRIGLVSLVTPQLAAAARGLAAELCGKAPIAMRLAKEALVGGVDMTLDQGIRFEQDLYALLQTTRDRATGVRAFLAKRRPRFRGV